MGHGAPLRASNSTRGIQQRHQLRGVVIGLPDTVRAGAGFRKGRPTAVRWVPWRGRTRTHACATAVGPEPPHAARAVAASPRRTRDHRLTAAWVSTGATRRRSRTGRGDVESRRQVIIDLLRGSCTGPGSLRSGQRRQGRFRSARNCLRAWRVELPLRPCRFPSTEYRLRGAEATACGRAAGFEGGRGASGKGHRAERHAYGDSGCPDSRGGSRVRRRME